MFNPHPKKRDDRLDTVLAESRAHADETRELIRQLRSDARLERARRHYEERLHGSNR